MQMEQLALIKMCIVLSDEGALERRTDCWSFSTLKAQTCRDIRAQCRSSVFRVVLVYAPLASGLQYKCVLGISV